MTQVNAQDNGNCQWNGRWLIVQVHFEIQLQQGEHGAGRAARGAGEPRQR